jgi:hypothetical protein
MAAQAREAERGGHLARQQVHRQQTPRRGRADAGDARLRVFPEAEAFQQADRGQRQQQDQRQVAGLDERRAQRFEHVEHGQVRGPAGHPTGHDHDQHGVGAQQESGGDGRDAEQRPQVDGGVHDPPAVVIA